MRNTVLAALVFAACAAGAEIVTSPGGAIHLTVETLENGQLAYEVAVNGRPLLLPSKLGLDLQGQPLLGPEVTLGSVSRGSVDASFDVVTGKANPVRDRYNWLKVDASGSRRWERRITIEARVYDDAVAFRYVVPQQESIRQLRLAKELTQFHVSKDATAYPLFLKDYRTSYENILSKSPLSRIPQAATIGLPLLINVPGVAWMAITEADLDEYAGMYLGTAAGEMSNSTLEVRLSPSITEPELAVTGTLPHRSPWRVLLVGTEPGRLIESNAIVALNPPPAITDTKWIRGGKAAWSWWSGNSATGAGFEGGMDQRTMQYYTDFAAQSGLEYLLVDAGWAARGDVTRMQPRIDIPELVKYAAARNVNVWLWLHWTSVDRQMEEAFPLYEKWGVTGVKIDFMDSNDQRMVDFYHRVVKKAAEHHLMVDFHGAYPPTGLQRTYPNLMTHEGVLGLEYNKWSAVPDPDHNVMLAFTRMLAGPMDYTPGGFENATRADFVARNKDPMTMGTRAHQIALYAVFESPLQMVSDRPGAYKDQPAFEFIRAVPTTWNQTRVLKAEVGEYVSIARRHGKEWYVGTITNWTPREIDLPLEFLEPGKYDAEIYSDAADSDRSPKNISIRKQPVDRSTVLRVTMAPGGGHAVRIRPRPAANANGTR